MYAALDKKGKLIYAQEALENKQYYCCHCDQQVKLILTDKRRYFRHLNQSHNTVNEGRLHQQGKQFLVEKCRKFQTLDVKTEVYLPKIQQRPDILVGTKLAVEYQCARIRLETFKKRVQGYQQVGIKSIWVLGGAYLQTNLQHEHLKFLDFTPGMGYFLMMYDASKRRFQLFHHIRFIGPFNKLFFQREIFSAKNLPNLFDYAPQEYWLQPQLMNDYLIQKLRQKVDLPSQRFKLAFFQRRQQTVEDYLKDRMFPAQAPIYKTPAWQKACGVIPKRLNQPLL